MTMAELKPCPFCGGEAIHGDGHGEPMIRVNHKRGCFLGALAICNNDAAVEAWNRRMTDETCEAELTYAERGRGTIKVFECSKCGKSWEQVWADDFTFCPYCGRGISHADE